MKIRNAKQGGFTIIEMMIALAALGVLVNMAVPAMGKMLAHHRVEAAANQLQLTLTRARSQAITQNRPIRVSFTGSGNNWTYGLGDTTACTPQTIQKCTINGVEKVFRGSNWHDVHMSINDTLASVDKVITFNPRRGLASGSSVITLSSTQGQTINVKVSPVGFISVCTAMGGNTHCA